MKLLKCYQGLLRMKIKIVIPDRPCQGRRTWGLTLALADAPAHCIAPLRLLGMSTVDSRGDERKYSSSTELSRPRALAADTFPAVLSDVDPQVLKTRAAALVLYRLRSALRSHIMLYVNS